MCFKSLLVLATVCSSAFLTVHAHGTITAVTGANGIQAAGFGIIATTPRNGALPKPFEQDTSVIRDREIASGKTGVCGRTAAGGNNDVASQLAAASQAGLPSAAADGSITMNLHQVNQDGAGFVPSLLISILSLTLQDAYSPYTCEVSGDGGNTFKAATVTTQVPGKFGLSFAAAKDFPLVAQMPAYALLSSPVSSTTEPLYSGMACTAGPNGDACIMRCRNPALAGPFGSCVAVANGGGAAGNVTAAATDSTSAPATAPVAAAPTAGAAAAGAATGTKGGLAGFLSKFKGGKLGGRQIDDGSAPAKRYIVSRIAGKRSGHWLNNQ
ncbi:hypothetical protein B0H15DRAFT_943086 [Mycena belliarum]|uniref:GEgh 16 protein n=1 Tax=Mycena belliarum TaxID=1033014 RepID=A0AAD6UFN8_9AGAR|nr:hypothetical protein B0H15DRAFT_943086 [Mycena belliae]